MSSGDKKSERYQPQQTGYDRINRIGIIRYNGGLKTDNSTAFIKCFIYQLQTFSILTVIVNDPFSCQNAI